MMTSSECGGRAPASILIVGDAVSALMTGVFCRRMYAETSTSIRIVITDTEELADGPVSVRPDFKDFLDYIALPEHQFLASTAAAFKLANVYTGWPAQGHYFFHTFGSYGLPMGAVPFHLAVNRLRDSGAATGPFHEYSLSAGAAMADRFAHPVEDTRSVFSTLSYGLHFNVKKFCHLLESQCADAGVDILRERSVGVSVSEDGVSIKAVQLANQHCVADLFIDCSKQRFLCAKLETSRKQPPISWQGTMPFNLQRSVTVKKRPRSYACDAIVAKKFGVEFLQADREFMRITRYSNTQAVDSEYEANIAPEGEWVGVEQRLVNSDFRAAQSWLGNCIAIGPAAIEISSPIVSAVDLTWAGLRPLKLCSPVVSNSESVQKAYSDKLSYLYDSVKDYAALVYDLVEPRDGVAWRKACEFNYTPAMLRLLQLYDSRGRAPTQEKGLFGAEEVLSLLMGLGRFPHSVDVLTQQVSIEQVQQHVKQIRAAVSVAVQKLPHHEEYLRRFLSKS